MRLADRTREELLDLLDEARGEADAYARDVARLTGLLEEASRGATAMVGELRRLEARLRSEPVSAGRIEVAIGAELRADPALANYPRTLARRVSLALADEGPGDGNGDASEDLASEVRRRDEAIVLLALALNAARAIAAGDVADEAREVLEDLEAGR